MLPGASPLEPGWKAPRVPSQVQDPLSLQTMAPWPLCLQVSQTVKPVRCESAALVSVLSLSIKIEKGLLNCPHTAGGVAAHSHL